MNMKVVSMCLICAGALLTGCGNDGKKEAETSERKEKEAVVGSDKDEHGCIASAGYTWSEVQKDCIRLWEKGVRMNAVDDAGKTLFLVQDGMDMDFAFVHPLHQLRNKVGRFTGTIDVVRQIADAVDHDQSEAVDFIDSVLDLLQPVFGRKTAQA